jgi:hypothetical protein
MRMQRYYELEKSSELFPCNPPEWMNKTGASELRIPFSIKSNNPYNAFAV